MRHEQPVRLQRVSARGALAVKKAAGRSRIDRLFQEGAAKIRMPETTADPLEAVLINTAGGLTGGDRLAWEIDVAADASAVVTTQACEKVYRAAADRAEVSCTIRVGERGRISWLPQETIAYDGCAFSRTLDVDVAPGAEALIVEAVLFGRLARGETVKTGSFRDRWRVRSEGRLVHGEDLAIGPDVDATLARQSVAGGAAAMATVLALGDVERWVEPAREIVGDGGGVSTWKVGPTGKLLARLLAKDGYALRRRLVPLVELLNGKAGLPKVWSL